MNVKYGMAKIPKFLLRIVVLNSPEYFWPPGIGIDLHEIIACRSQMFFFNSPLVDISLLSQNTNVNIYI